MSKRTVLISLCAIGGYIVARGMINNIRIQLHEMETEQMRARNFENFRNAMSKSFNTFRVPASNDIH